MAPMAFRKPVNQSSTRENENRNAFNTAENTVDGRRDTRSWTGVDRGEWWQIDFNEIVPFDDIYLIFAGYGNFRKKTEGSLVNIFQFF